MGKRGIRVFEHVHLEEAYALNKEFYEVAKLYQLNVEKDRLQDSTYDTYQERIQTMIGWIWRNYILGDESDRVGWKKKNYRTLYEKEYKRPVTTESILHWNWKPMFVRSYLDHLCDRYDEDDISADYINSVIHALASLKTWWGDFAANGTILEYSFRKNKREYETRPRLIKKTVQLGATKEEYLEIMHDREILRSDEFSHSMKINPVTALELIELIEECHDGHYTVDIYQGKYNAFVAKILKFSLFTGGRLMAILRLTKDSVIWCDPSKYSHEELHGKKKIKKRDGTYEEQNILKNKVKKIIHSDYHSAFSKLQSVISYFHDKGNLSRNSAIFEGITFDGKTFEDEFYELWNSLEKPGTPMFVIKDDGYKIKPLEQTMKIVEQVVHQASQLYLAQNYEKLGLKLINGVPMKLASVKFKQPQYETDSNGERRYEVYYDDSLGREVKKPIPLMRWDEEAKKEVHVHKIIYQTKVIKPSITVHSFRKGSLSALYFAVRELSMEDIKQLIFIHKHIQLERSVKEINYRIDLQWNRLNAKINTKNEELKAKGLPLIPRIQFNHYQLNELYCALWCGHSRVGLLNAHYLDIPEDDIQRFKRERLMERHKAKKQWEEKMKKRGGA